MATVEEVAGWNSRLDGADWVELQAWSEELRSDLKTVGDLVALLEAIDRRYEGRE